MSVIHRTTVSPAGSKKTWVWSTPRPDSYDDIVGDISHPTLGWDWKDFFNNSVCLLNHNNRDIIGRWENPRIENGALVGDLVLAPPETSALVAEVHSLIACGALKACSVGFVSQKSEPRGGDSSGRKYTRMRLVEVSLCAVGANADALLQARALGVSGATIRKIFKEQNNVTTLDERIAAAKLAVKRYSMEERRAIHARAKALLAKSGYQPKPPQQKLLTDRRSESVRRARAMIEKIDARIAREAPLLSPKQKARIEQDAYNREVHKRAKELDKKYQEEKAAGKKAFLEAIQDPPKEKRESFVVWRGVRIPIGSKWNGEDV